ncbi:DDE-type integrase/transposase/recombinase [Streptomyces sp. NBC_00285]|uniref:DDE-type integrase/transposase/recombinase n=1 Tax=Streptomyces sp. NBC_00285 TaxID=2975700 RepID=UPI002E2BDF34|nr:DDE-type integrase/transposase/recombinase [Streptomyces sp. NBC_00285]
MGSGGRCPSRGGSPSPTSACADASAPPSRTRPPHRFPELFQRDFTAAEPGRLYMGDITYLPLAGGEFLYLATVLDCFSRKVVGWRTPDEVFEEQLRSLQQPGVATTG